MKKLIPKVILIKMNCIKSKPKLMQLFNKFLCGIHKSLSRLRLSVLKYLVFSELKGHQSG
jgi:hypothetical protein